MHSKDLMASPTGFNTLYQESRHIPLISTQPRICSQCYNQMAELSLFVFSLASQIEDMYTSDCRNRGMTRKFHVCPLKLIVINSLRFPKRFTDLSEWSWCKQWRNPVTLELLICMREFNAQLTLLLITASHLNMKGIVMSPAFQREVWW